MKSPYRGNCKLGYVLIFTYGSGPTTLCGAHSNA